MCNLQFKRETAGYFVQLQSLNKFQFNHELQKIIIFGVKKMVIDKNFPTEKFILLIFVDSR
jgi:hypothetical protein